MPLRNLEYPIDPAIRRDHARCRGTLRVFRGNGRVVVCLNATKGDYHMAVAGDAGTQEVLEALAWLREVLGLHLLDIGEDEPWVLPSGWVQRVLTTSTWDMPQVARQREERSA